MGTSERKNTAKDHGCPKCRVFPVYGNWRKHKIRGSNPDVGCISDDVFEAYAFSQTIRVGDHLYLCGIAPLRGSNDNVELVGKGDIRAQVGFCLDVFKQCLIHNHLRAD